MGCAGKFFEFSKLLVHTQHDFLLTACSREDTPRLNMAAVAPKYPDSDSRDATQADVLGLLLAAPREEADV